MTKSPANEWDQSNESMNKICARCGVDKWGNFGGHCSAHGSHFRYHLWMRDPKLPPLPISENKKCIRCGIVKPLVEYDENKSSPDGHSGTCKKCRAEYMVEYRKDHLKITQEKIKQRYALQFKLGEVQASSKLRYEVKMGRVAKKPCAVCGNNKAEAHHHFGYDKPLEVVWLCTKHHKQHHAFQDKLIFTSRQDGLDEGGNNALKELEEGVKPLFRDEFNNYTRRPEDIEDDVLSLINNLKKGDICNENK